MDTVNVISTKRGRTKYGNPMWICKSDNGVTFFIFADSDPERDTVRLFDEYGLELEALADGEELKWEAFPISVVIEKKDGGFYKPVSVAARPFGAGPDQAWYPDPITARLGVIARCRSLISNSNKLAFLDTETDGKDANTASPIQIAVQTWDPDCVGGQHIMTVNTWHSLVLTADPDRLLKKDGEGTAPADIHGITPEMLRGAPSFPSLYEALGERLNGRIWLAYNAKFDCRVLWRSCVRAGLAPFAMLSEVDIMELASIYHGEWVSGGQYYRSHKLGEIAGALGVTVEVSHQALADVETAAEVLKAMAHGRHMETIIA